MNGNGGGGESGKVGAGLQAGGKRQAGCQLNLLLQLTHILGWTTCMLSKLSFDINNFMLSSSQLNLVVSYVLYSLESKFKDYVAQIFEWVGGQGLSFSNGSVSFLLHLLPCPSTSMRDSGAIMHWGGWIRHSNKDKYWWREETSAFILFNKLGN